MILVGCQPPIETSGTTEDEPKISGQEIWQTVFEQYSNAQTYQDQAVVYLSYRLDGSAIKEPHRWSIAWNRNGDLSADLFNAKIRISDKQLSCYIFDIETGNLDNQQMFRPQGEIQDIFNDKIAHHFVTGMSELPLDEVETQSSENRLLHPILGFLDPSLMPQWVQAPDSVRRLDDDSSLGLDCYVLELVHKQKIFQVWIEKSSGKIEQIGLPLEYLDSQILAADEVTHLNFIVRFHDAVLDGEISKEQFVKTARIGAKQVRNFVSLPQALPSDRLGDAVGPLNLQTPVGQAIALPKSNVKVLVWLAEFSAGSVVDKFSELASKFDQPNIDFVAIYSEDLLAEVASSKKYPISEIRAAAESNNNLQLGFDSKIEFGSTLKLKSLPSLVILDGNQRMQFVKRLDEENWETPTAVAISRILKGENVAEEMTTDYQKFLDEYHQLVSNSSRSTDDAHATGDEIEFRRLWQSKELVSPGNVHIPENTSRIFILDGTQSVVEFDANGNIANRIRLQIPPTVAVNRIRSLTKSNGIQAFAVFSMLGKKVFVFDEQWNPIFQFDVSAELASPTTRITECQLIPASNDNIELWISFVDKNGIVKFTPESGIQRVSAGACKSFLKTKSHLYAITNDRFEIDGTVATEVENWNFKLLARSFTDDRGCIAVGSNGENHWRLFRFDGNGNKEWSHRVAPQFPNNTVESVIYSGDSVAMVYESSLVIADAFGIRNWGETEMDQINGVGYLAKSKLILCNNQHVVAFSANTPKPEKAVPVSTPDY